MKDNRRNFIKKSMMTAADVSVMPASYFAFSMILGDYQVEIGEPGTQNWKIMNGLEAGFKGRANLKIDF